MNVKRMISMVVMLVITVAVMAREGELAMNENVSGKDNVSSNEEEATPVDRKPKVALISDVYGEIPVTKPVFEAEHHLESDIIGKQNTFIQNYTHEYDIAIGFTDSLVEILKPSIYKAVNKVNKYYKKALREEEVSWEVTTFNMGYILDCASMMCFGDSNKPFEGTLKPADEPEETIALFNQVTLRKL